MATSEEALNMAGLAREHQAMLAEIVRANSDLGSRMEQLGVSVDYNEAEDILLLTIGTPTEALTETVDNSIGLHVDPDTLKLIGLEILGFRAALARNAFLPLFLLHLMAAMGARVHTPPAEPARNPHERLAADIRELVTV